MPGGEPVRRSLGLPRFPHFTAAAETLADVLASDTERRHRPMAPGTGQPGLIFRFADAVERILFIGDLHPTSQTQDNLQVLLEPVWNDLLSGRLGLVILGDFTHPGDGDMTDMKPSIHLFTDLLAPLKVMFPDRVALLRGDHESVGSPFGLDFGKAAGGIPARSAGDNLLEMITDGVIWMFAPQQPAHLEQDDEYAGLWDLSPTAERYCLKGNRLLAKGYEGRWYDFSHLEPGSTEIEMVFRNQDNPLDIRTLRPRLENDVIHFMVSGDCDYDGCRCTMVLNQSKLFGAAVAAVAGNDFPSFLQARVYDRLPLIATGKSFIANHAAPPWQLNDTPRPPNGIDELLELQPLTVRPMEPEPWFSLIFGRPFESGRLCYDQDTIRRFNALTGISENAFYVVGHTTPETFLGTSPKTLDWHVDIHADALIRVHAHPPVHFILDSQQTEPTGLLVDNTSPPLASNPDTHWRLHRPE